MSTPVNINFTQMISPGGAAPAAPASSGGPSIAEFGGALLSQAPGVALGFVTGGPVGAGVSLAKGLISMVIGGDSNKGGEADSAGAGQKVPFLDGGNPLETVQDSLSALQNVLTSLFVAEPVKTASQGIDPTLTEAVTANPAAPAAPIFTGKTLDAYRAAAGLGTVSGKEVDLTVDGNPQKDALLPGTPTVNTKALPEVAVKQDGQAVQVPVTGNNTNPNANSQQDALLKLKAENTTTKSGDPVRELLTANNTNPEGLAESVRKLKSLSALTPIPTGYGFTKPDQNGQISTPLDKLANIQSDIAPVKPEVDKLLSKQLPAADSLAQSNAQPAAPAASQPAAPVVTTGAVKEEVAIKPAEVKPDNAPDDLALPVRGETHNVKANAADFSQALSKTIVASPAEQVAAKLTQLPSGKQSITVELEPVSLGKVHVKVEWAPDGKTQINIAAERKETMDALKADSATLSRALADSGIKTDSASLQFSFKGHQEFAAGAFADNKGSSNQGGQSMSGQGADVTKENVQEASLARSLHINGLLDLRV